MMKCDVKIGRKHFLISEKDLFLDNGACMQLITQKIPVDAWSYTCPKLSKVLVKQWESAGILYTNDSLKTLAKQHYHSFLDNLAYYKVDMEKLQATGKYEVVNVSE
jgi:hypothetical protein